MAPRCRNSFNKLLPAWLTTGDGEKVWFSLGVVMDRFLERAWQGHKARFPSFAPADALTALGRDRKIVRGINESADSFAIRQHRWLDDHRIRGNPFALLEQLRAYCNVDMVARTVDRRGSWYTVDADGVWSFRLAEGNWDWDGGPVADWSRFWVILYPPTSLWTQSPAWGGANLWGGKWGSTEHTWGSSATPDQVAAVRSIVSEWQPKGVRCEYIILAFDPTSFDPAGAPGAPLPDGTWAYNHLPGSDPAVAARLSTATYWPGPPP